MIATIDIKVNAAHPNIPLAPLYAFVGSPSSVRIRNVPQRVGKWQIDAVSVTVALPDNSSTTVPAVAVCGCWVATLPSCDVTGYCASGLQITASGTDENGAAVTGYCLGVGDVTILPRDATAVSNGTRYYLHYVAEQPEHPNPGDMCYIDGVPKWYDGTAWQTFAAGGASIDVVPPSTDPTDAGKAADAKATGDALAGKLTRAEAEAGFTEWTLTGIPSGATNIQGPNFESGEGGLWCHLGFTYNGVEYNSWPFVDSESVTSVEFNCSDDLDTTSYPVTATRTRLPTMADIPTKTSDLTNDSGFLTQHQQLAPVYSQTPTFQWACRIGWDEGDGFTGASWANDEWSVSFIYYGQPYTMSATIVEGTGAQATKLSFDFDGDTYFATRTRTDIVGYTLGSQTPHLQPQGDYAPSSALRYDLPANATAITSASSEVVEGETVTYGEATLADRTANRVEVTAAIAELRLTFPAAVSGKVRDFGLRVEVGTGSAALAAPALVPPAGVTLENSDGAIPALADGTATAVGVTLLYFSETAPGKFLAKGEEAKEVA